MKTAGITAGRFRGSRLLLLNADDDTRQGYADGGTVNHRWWSVVRCAVDHRRWSIVATVPTIVPVAATMLVCASRRGEGRRENEQRRNCNSCSKHRRYTAFRVGVYDMCHGEFL